MRRVDGEGTLSPAEFLNRLYSDSEETSDETLYLCLAHVDALLCEGRMSEVDQIIREADTCRLSTLLLVNLLITSGWAKQHLANRNDFAEKAQATIIERHGPTEAVKILWGLVAGSKETGP